MITVIWHCIYTNTTKHDNYINDDNKFNRFPKISIYLNRNRIRNIIWSWIKMFYYYMYVTGNHKFCNNYTCCLLHSNKGINFNTYKQENQEYCDRGR